MTIGCSENAIKLDQTASNNPNKAFFPLTLVVSDLIANIASVTGKIGDAHCREQR